MKNDMGNQTRYGDMTVNPDHTPRKLAKDYMIERKSIFYKQLLI